MGSWATINNNYPKKKAKPDPNSDQYRPSCPADTNEMGNGFAQDKHLNHRLKCTFSNSESEIKVAPEKSPVITVRRRAQSLNGDDLQSELSCFTARRSIIAVYTERDPLSEVWTDVCCPDLQLELHYLRMRVRDFQLSCCRGRHAQSSTTVNAIEASPTTTVSPEIQLINLDHFQPRIRRSPEVTKQKLLVSEQFICPTREGKLRGNLREDIEYSEISCIGYGNTGLKPFFQIFLCTVDTEECICNSPKSYIFSFGHYSERDHCMYTILWRAYCFRIIHRMREENISPADFELLFKDFIRSHEKYHIHKVSAYQQINDTISRIIQEQSDEMLDYISDSRCFIKNLEEFLEYNPILSPELSNILERHCLSPNKSRRTERIVRAAVIRAIHTFTFNAAKDRYLDVGAKEKAEKIRSSLRRLALVYINMATGGVLPYCSDSDIKPINKEEVTLAPIRETIGLADLVRDLHGKGKCPHLLTLDNIFRIAKTAIEQCYPTSTNPCCILCPTHCPFAKRLFWAELGIKFLLNAAEYEDWQYPLSELITPFPFPKSTKSCKVFGNLLLPLLTKLIQTGNAFTLSGISSTRQDARSYLKLSSINYDKSRIQSNETPHSCFIKDVREELYKEFLIAFQEGTFSDAVVLKELSEKYLEDVWFFARNELDAAIEFLIKCLNSNLLGRGQKDETKLVLKATPQGNKRYGLHIRERARFTAPGGNRIINFRTHATDEEVLAELEKARPGDLEDLNLSCTAITDYIAEGLVKLPQLKTLNLMTTRITDNGLLILSYAPVLQELNLNECDQITPNGFRHLTRLRNLTKLSINCTSLNDEVFKELRNACPSLRNVDHRYTDVTDVEPNVFINRMYS